MTRGPTGALAVGEHVPLAPRTTLELGGSARFFVEATSVRDVEDALAFAADRGAPLVVLGGGSNVVVADAGFDGVVVGMRTLGVRSTRRAGLVEVQAAAGEGWDALVAQTVAEGWAGLECLSGIPGLVGATPIQNVGAYGQDVSETIASVRVLDRRTREIVDLAPRDLAFSYRDSALKRDPMRAVVLGVTFRLRPGGAPKVAYAELEKALAEACAGQDEGSRTLARVRETVIALRRRKSMVLDPADPNRRSAGSFFTNPIVEASVADEVVRRALAAGIAKDARAVPRWAEAGGRVKLAAGWLIEQAGIGKGLRRGPVGVSSAHALALVHHGGGTTAELLALAEEIRTAVRARWGVELEREPVLLGA